MNVVIEDESKKNKRLKSFYILVILICIVALAIASILQLKIDNRETKTKLPQLTEEQLTNYKMQFNSIFLNKVNYLENNSYKITKIKDEEEIVYLGYQKKETKPNDYELNINIPYINIKGEITEKFNKQIKDIFEKKAQNVLNTTNENIIYTVNYSAYVTNNILSLIIRSTLKEGENPQRDIVQTYNYDLTKQEECGIEEILNLKEISKQEANQRIRAEIKEVQQRVEELQKLGYSVYQRNYDSDLYNINNVTEFFLGENNALYIIFAYGNENHTSEMDLIVM